MNVKISDAFINTNTNESVNLYQNKYSDHRFVIHTLSIYKQLEIYLDTMKSIQMDILACR